MPRAIVHLDADAFFASVEQAADARLRGKPVAVGGEKRGIIASASYEARRFGVYTPMPTALARRLCPRLIILPGDFDKYELFSRLMFAYAYDFTPEVEIGSIDEGYFDLTGARQPALGIAERIRHAIRQSLKLSVSEGIGSNKLVSQIASKLKKPAAFQFVPPGLEAPFLSPLANQWLPGVGPGTATQLNAAGLTRIGQIAQTPVELLGLLVGRLAPQLRRFALGLDERPVVPARAPPKSYGEQETFAADTTDEEFLQATLRRMADKLMAKVRADGKSIRTLAVKVRYNDMTEEQASQSLAEPTDLETELYANLSTLLRKAWQRRVSLRLVSLKLSQVYEGRYRSGLALDASARRHDAQQRLADTVDDLRQTYGRRVLFRGHDFILCAKNDQSEQSTNGTRVQPVGRARCPHRAAADAGPPNGAVGTRVLPASITTTRTTTRTTRTIAIPLNVHSYYSFLDSTLAINALVDWAKRHELPAIALTDKNNLHGAVEFAQAAARAGVKPILGAELEYGGRRLCLYVENQKGYHNLCRILTEETGDRKQETEHRRQETGDRRQETEHRRQETGNRKQETGDRSQKSGVRSQESRDRRQAAGVRSRETEAGRDGSVSEIKNLKFKIQNSADGLLAVSPSAELAQFFPGRFYLEVNSLEAFRRRPAPLPCVASFPIHYERPADCWKYDVVQSIRTLTLLRQAHPAKRLDGEFHFRSPAELQSLFAAQPELLAHSREIAERCSFAFSLGKPQFPGYAPPDGSTPAAFLRRLVLEGLQRRYPKDHARLKPQLEQELVIITEVGYEEYFLVMWDILQECRRRGIEWITRGSAADSLACYCLGISGVCPIRFDLYFRRFLNKDRMALHKLPDIDVDFPHDRKDDVIDLIFEKYGPAHTAIVGGFSTFQSRSAFAEVAKVLGVSEYQVRRITERLPYYSRASDLAEAVAGAPECRDLPLDQEPYATALRMAHFLDGFPRYPKMHPCGLVLSRQPMDEIVPCFVSAKGYPTTHFDMDSLEAVGLVKMDILAQGGLAVMRDVKEMLGEETGVRRQETGGDSPQSTVHSPQSTVHSPQSGQNPVSSFQYPGSRITHHASRPPSPTHPLTDSLTHPLTDSLTHSFTDSLEPWADPRVWELIAGGNARAVHHIESPAMISLCKMCNARDIDTLIAIVSVIRPGAANESKKMEFARRYQGLSPVRYPHPSLEPCLRSTYGLVVYEEHILQICEAFAGLPPGRADILRRALGKNKTDVITQIQTEFAARARRRGRAEAEIAEVWNLVAGFKGYAFCKAHSTAYGVEAYESAWLKCYYPAEFMAAVLTNGKGFYHPLVYVLECHRLGIPLLPPSVNDPGPQFTVVEGAPLPQVPLSHPMGSPLPIRLGEGPGVRVLGSGEGSGEGSGVRAMGSGEGRGEGNASLPSPVPKRIRVPVLRVKGLTNRTRETILHERARVEFGSLADFFLRVQPLNEEMEALIRVGAFDPFGQTRTTQYWQFKSLCGLADAPTHSPMESATSRLVGTHSLTHSLGQLWLLPPANLDRLPSVPLAEPGRLQRLRWEEELLGYPASGHPLELYPDIAWETYCPVNRLGEHVGEEIVACGLVIEQRLFHQITGEPMKFITLADWTGVVETELFARTYKSYGLNTVRYRVLEITATVEPFENGRGYTLRVLRAGKPRTRKPAGNGG